MFKILLRTLLILVLVSCSSDASEECCAVDTIDPELTYNPENWMWEILTRHPEVDVTLRDICYPRSHDAGMYVVQNCTIGASECNVQNQDQDMKAQLLDGIRSFDIRPLYKNNVFFTRHSRGCDGLGCYGVRVDNMLVQLKEFLDSHAELVFIEFSFWCYTDGDDPLFRDLLQSTLGNRLFIETEDISTPFINRSLKDIIPPDQSTGKAVAIVSGVSNTAANRAEGMFSSNYILKTGSFANAQNFPDMKSNQFSKYRNYDNDGSRLFKLVWTLTQDAEQAISCVLPGNQQSIESLAGMVNPELQPSMDELIASGDIRKGRIPNVISVDFCEEFVTETCIAITRLNLE